MTRGETRRLNFGTGEYSIDAVENIGDTDLLFAAVEFFDGGNKTIADPRGDVAADSRGCEINDGSLIITTSACSGEVSSGSPRRTLVRRQEHAPTVEFTAFSDHMGSHSESHMNGKRCR
jgi:hypothetical protein